MYEGGIRVPAIVRWPDRIEAGTESDRITGFEDWLPTLAELALADAPVATDGISFASTLLGEDQPERPFLYREFAGYGGWQAVWVGDHKLVRKDLQKQPKLELYALTADPGEAKDLAKTQRERVRALTAIAEREHVPSATFPLGAIDGR
jgi:arylsulfatase A-like enzyme